MTMHYPVVLHKDKASDFGVTVPDLPGCFSAGSSVDEALAMAKEAIELHLEGLIDDGLPVPEPTGVDKHAADRDFAGGTWALVEIDRTNLRVKAKRINVTMPERILDAVDRFAAQRGETRSGLLAVAVSEYMARQTSGENPRGKRKVTRKA